MKLTRLFATTPSAHVFMLMPRSLVRVMVNPSIVTNDFEDIVKPWFRRLANVSREPGLMPPRLTNRPWSAT